jgi:hypothetical protein
MSNVQNQRQFKIKSQISKLMILSQWHFGSIMHYNAAANFSGIFVVND